MATREPSPCPDYKLAAAAMHGGDREIIDAADPRRPVLAVVPDGYAVAVLDAVRAVYARGREDRDADFIPVPVPGEPAAACQARERAAQCALAVAACLAAGDVDGAGACLEATRGELAALGDL